MLTGSVMSGRSDVSVMTWGPVAGMVNSIASAGQAPGTAFAFASRIAWRRLAPPESLLFRTSNTAAGGQVLAAAGGTPLASGTMTATAISEDDITRRATRLRLVSIEAPFAHYY